MAKEFLIKVGSHHTIDELISLLVKFGYERVAIIEKPGDFDVVGGNILIFGADSLNPVKVEFFGNTVDQISLYTLSTGKVIGKTLSANVVTNVLILPDGTKVKPGDYVVHEDHGIGLFSNFETKIIEEKNQLYILLRYLNNSALYVPVELKDKISLYIGVGRKKPKLNRLGSESWKKAYKRTYENVIQMAKELLIIYARREIVKRKPLKINKDWDLEINKTFQYRATNDQKNAIEDVLNDLSRDFPMDRLVCGDVGFGKTEVAIRAACQAIANGYQVAILVPTTILAEQHYFTLKDRFKNLPVSIERLSRFIKTSSQSETINDINSGKVDLVVGTHKLFSKNIKFKNLGLLIIDEEQKFGVKDKEKLKKLRTNINVISLTATPIPRTLFMSLSGIRDLSQISSPPAGRREIETVVSVYDELLIKNKIETEISRGGQVYYLHNEVGTIGGTKNKLQKMFPELRISVAHGQQSEGQLASTMSDFTQGKIDLLVCSTIIENGLDLPNVNTLIVEDADKFGLSQLYQIRGRIGRSKKQAYAVFTHKQKKITDNAFKRFRALVENTELGSGYNIALSDLEIRGGGNILGREQHGNMESVGLVLYSKLLNQAVLALRSKKGLTQSSLELQMPDLSTN